MAFTTKIEKVWNGSIVQVLGYKTVKKGIFEIGLAVEGQAKLLAPVDTGQGAGSITTQSIDNGTNVVSPATASDQIQKPREDLQVLVGTAVEHMIYQEFGTVKMNAQPFLRPAFATVQGQALTLVEHAGRVAFKDYLA